MNKISKKNTDGNFANTVLADAIFRPILFSTPMVQAILDGRKTQTRRIIKNYPTNDEAINLKDVFEHNSDYVISQSPYGKVGDTLWVRETFTIKKPIDAEQDWQSFGYKSDGYELRPDEKWKPSIFMSKEACRLFLEVTKVRVERLNDISEMDARSEGVEFYFNEMFQETRFKDYQKAKPGGFKPQRFYKTERPILGYGEWREAISSFISLWESINGRKSWDKNPWVWVYEFKRIERPSGFC